MRIIVAILFMLLAFVTKATNFYVCNTGDNNNNGLSPLKAWQTLSKVESAARSGLIKAGDSILFKKGDSFIGRIKWTTLAGQTLPTGKKNMPITFSSYGNGPKPVFQYPKEIIAKPENRVLMWFVGVDYIVIDGLNFTDSDNSNDKKTPANCGVPIFLGSMDDSTTNHCTVKNVDISLCGMGVVIVGDSNTITKCSFVNFKNLKSTPDVGGSSAYEDYGANGVTITGSDNEISYNLITGAWAESLDFGWNGGAIEMFNTCNRNKIIHNNISDCGGIAEFGGFKKGSYAEDNVFADNLITNCGTLSWCNLTGPLPTVVSNIQYLNNTIIENNNSRFSGPKTGEGITTPGPLSKITPDKFLFAYNGPTDVDVIFTIKNNNFILSTGIAVAKKANDMSKYVHEKNVYRLSNGSETIYELDPTEKIIAETKK